MIVTREVKEARVTIRVTQEEKDLWQLAADNAGMKLAAYIRQVMNEKTGKGE